VGVKDYSIYVSDDGGPFTAFQADTMAAEADFTGQPGHRYAFYSLARDWTGHLESDKALPDVATKVAIAGDVNDDDAVDCADVALIRASFGRRTGQAGFDRRADAIVDGIINVRDLAFVTQKLPVGTRCQ
jgi:hypothetical protein